MSTAADMGLPLDPINHDGLVRVDGANVAYHALIRAQHRERTVTFG